jgi:hypothetical protein
MANVFDRLNLDFDLKKFGDSLNLSTKASNYLNTSPVGLDSTTANALANGSISRTDYFKNPVSDLVAGITSNVNSILTICLADPINQFPTTYETVSLLANTANNLLLEIVEFNDHTDRISGVSDRGTDSETVGIKPTYSDCISTGSYLTMLIASSDGRRDAAPVLGNFTSLYIEDELTSNNNTIGADYSTMLSSFGGGPSSSLSNTEISLIRTHLETSNTLMYTRRISDENFFYNSQNIVLEYQFLNSLTTSGSTERNLINNKIGTNKLKNIVGNS